MVFFETPFSPRISPAQVFPGGAKTGEPEPYEGGRDASSIIEFARSKAMESKPAPEVKEIVSNDVFEASCTNHQVSARRELDVQVASAS
jgi:hypothetical protein